MKKNIVLKNSLLIGAVIFSLFSSTLSARAASLSVSPASATYRVGETFTVNFFISSPDQAINTCQTEIKFSSDVLQVVSVPTKPLVFSFMVEPATYSNNVGTLNFSGVILNPGFTGLNGLLLTVNFKAKAPGTAKISYASGQILANDGAGTDVLAGTSGATFTIVEPVPLEVPQIKETPAATTATSVIQEHIPPGSLCACCNWRYLPNFFLKIGNLIFGSGRSICMAISLIILLLLLLAVLIWSVLKMFSKEKKYKK